MIIAIDGPAGSGKSTTARAVAAELGYLFVDTGAMYRAATVAVARMGGLSSIENLHALFSSVTIELVDREEGQHVFLDGEDVTEEIRTPDVSAGVSAVSAEADVRQCLVREQRAMANRAVESGNGVVMEGRDIGSVVFPDADLKVFLTADVKERARRRMADLVAKGHASRLDAVADDIVRRDAYDSNRTVSPLTKADDAVTLDTTGLSIDEQVARIVTLAMELGA